MASLKSCLLAKDSARWDAHAELCANARRVSEWVANMPRDQQERTPRDDALLGEIKRSHELGLWLLQRAYLHNSPEWVKRFAVLHSRYSSPLTVELAAALWRDDGSHNVARNFIDRLPKDNQDFYCRNRLDLMHGNMSTFASMCGDTLTARFALDHYTPSAEASLLKEVFSYHAQLRQGCDATSEDTMPRRAVLFAHLLILQQLARDDYQQRIARSALRRLKPSADMHRITHLHPISVLAVLASAGIHSADMRNDRWSALIGACTGDRWRLVQRYKLWEVVDRTMLDYVVIHGKFGCLRVFLHHCGAQAFAHRDITLPPPSHRFATDSELTNIECATLFLCACAGGKRSPFAKRGAIQISCAPCLAVHVRRCY